ncbi:hypothetical protein [Costertonia aggregata]|uniref:Uncharacterized protein n=1 Tax=Costertonia aggregata TaxID=343403 RepID=A0A7H9ATM5_9FLAO|nr:hypothetical protein [Costertonia aggregata]QLG46799.1 hypothetical protein HYG79_16055 [Costertonia aggregata]
MMKKTSDSEKYVVTAYGKKQLVKRAKASPKKKMEEDTLKKIEPEDIYAMNIFINEVFEKDEYNDSDQLVLSEETVSQYLMTDNAILKSKCFKYRLAKSKNITMDTSLIIAIILGVANVFLLYLVVYKIHSKTEKINPVVGLVVFYVLFFIVPEYLHSIMPQAWLIQKYENPFFNSAEKMQSIQFLFSFLKINTKMLSAFDVFRMVTFTGIIIYFLKTFLFNKFFWKSP